MDARPRARYREIPPSAELRTLVECFWVSRSNGRLAGEQASRVVPDGCTDIIVDLGDPATAGGAPRRRPRSYFVGAMRRALRVRMTGTVDLIGVRLRPGTGGALLGMPATEVTDRTVALDDVLPGRPAEPLEEALAGAERVERRVEAFEAMLRDRFAVMRPPPRAVGEAVAMIERSRGGVTVRELQDRIGLSARQLQRLFAQFVGVSPKTACRVVRFRSAWRRLNRAPAGTLATLAYGCGYADQAHFTREFKEFAGITPGERAARRVDVASVQDGRESPG